MKRGFVSKRLNVRVALVQLEAMAPVPICRLISPLTEQDPELTQNKEVPHYIFDEHCVRVYIVHQSSSSIINPSVSGAWAVGCCVRNI